MTPTVGRAVRAAIAAALLFPAVALAVHAKVGLFTSTTAGIQVGKGGATIVRAQVDCKQGQGHLTLQTIVFEQPIAIKPSGSFAYHGQAFYATFGNHRSRPVTASISGKFVTSTQVKGTVKHGPGACRRPVRFAATYTARAR